MANILLPGSSYSDVAGNMGDSFLDIDVTVPKAKFTYVESVGGVASIGLVAVSTIGATSASRTTTPYLQVYT